MAFNKSIVLPYQVVSFNLPNEYELDQIDLIVICIDDIIIGE